MEGATGEEFQHDCPSGKAEFRRGGVSMIVGNSPWARTVRRSIKRIASGQSTVMIAGPSGTGKELIARAIHEQSPRAASPLVVVDCASIPTTLFASQLFGHVKGAFSGADCDTLGSFRAAAGRTVFLDELGELPLELQSQLLRVIQERAVMPVGSHRGIPVDVRIVAATNRELSREVEARRFRLDLYYRLNVVRLTTTPLRERPEDIEPLCHCFLDRWSIENGLPRRWLSPAAVRLLMACDWPGNVRQLQNVLERAAVFADDEEITPQQLEEFLEPEMRPAIAGSIGQREETDAADRRLCGDCDPARPACMCGGDAWPTMAECECRLIRATLERAFYNQSAAARLLGVDWRLLSRKMEKHGISLPRSRSRAA